MGVVTWVSQCPTLPTTPAAIWHRGRDANAGNQGNPPARQHKHLLAQLGWSTPGMHKVPLLAEASYPTYPRVSPKAEELYRMLVSTNDGFRAHQTQFQASSTASSQKAA